MHDTLDFTGAEGWRRTGVVTLLMRQMRNRGITSWAWNDEDRLEILAPDSPTFMREHRHSDNHRLHPGALAYLIGDFHELDAIGRYIPLALAYKVFGQQFVDDAADRVCDELFCWG